MFRQLLKLEWKSFFRSASMKQDLAMRIFLAFLALYFGVSYLLLGIALYPMLRELYPGSSPLLIVNGYVGVWILLEFILRYMMQKMPVVNIRPLLTANIQKATIVHFVLLKSALSFFNVLAPLLFIPFGIWCVVRGDISGLELCGWWAAMFSIMMIINYLNLYINKKFADNIKGLLPIMIIVAGLIALQYFNIFSTTALIGSILDGLIARPYLAIIPLAFIPAIYYLNFKYLKNNFYLDAAFKTSSGRADTLDLSWTRKLGSIAPYVRQDLRLLRRNKRPRTTVILAFAFTAYGLLFFSVYDNNIDFMIPFLGVFMTGMFVINFGQFIPAWDSTYFSMMMTQNIPLKQYLNAKAGLMYISIVILTILTTPYVYFGAEVLITFIACGIYNAGINVPMILFAGSFNKKRIDLEKSQFMNYQGTGAAQWIIGIPLLTIPLMIWLPAYFIFNAVVASVILALIGITGLLIRNYLMEQITQSYKKRKYQMVSGFRQVG